VTVLGFALAGTLGMALGGLFLLRYLGPELGFRNAALIIGLAIAALTALCGLMLVRLLLGPMQSLARYAGAVRTGAASDATPPDQFGTREIGATAAAVIDMAEALKTRETTIRSYSDHVTHELKGPVSAVLAAAELLQDRELGDAERGLVDQISGAALQMNAELDALRRVVRAREANYKGESSLDAIMPLLTTKATKTRIDVEGGDHALPLAGDGLTLILEHLLANAEAHGARRVRLCVGDATLDVKDDGSGIPDADRLRIFEPFFTTRRDSGGTGMGLAIVRSILAAHGGSISALSSDCGAHFRIAFPS